MCERVFLTAAVWLGILLACCRNTLVCEVVLLRWIVFGVGLLLYDVGVCQESVTILHSQT